LILKAFDTLFNKRRKVEIAPMTDRLRSSYERDWSPYTKKAARSAVLAAIGQAINSHFEVPQAKENRR
jgi:hypothetical protein